LENTELKEAGRILSIEEGSAEDLMKECNALWIHTGNLEEPHAILASGKHSDGYINTNAVLKFTNLNQILANQLISEVLTEIENLNQGIDVVVSSSFAAITFGQEVARQLGTMFVFTEKSGEEQKWGGRFDLPKGAHILQIEELITTNQTARKVREAVLSANPTVKFLEINGKTLVGTIVYRPADLSIKDPEFEIVALLSKEIHVWGPAECPLCKKGSPALKPKANWQRFLEHR
jgi:orotate phosphoribosyltransferase